LIRKEAIGLIAKRLGNSPIVSANGFISRDLFELCDKPSNFYMIGSMGLSSSIGLGIALKNPRKKVYIFDGDGNILMNLGSLTTIGTKKPKNLFHIVFDNGVHESTGGQPSNSMDIQIDAIAKASNYTVFRTSAAKKLQPILDKTKKIKGPILLLIKVEKSDNVSARVIWEPRIIKTRFMKSLNSSLKC